MMAGDDLIPAQIAGYQVFPVVLPPQPSFPKKVTHYFYVKPHDPKIPDAATPRSLFLVNIPFDSTSAHLKHLFSVQLGLPSGRIADVVFHDRDEAAIASANSSVLPLLPPSTSTTAGAPSRKRKRERAVVEGLPPLDPSLPPVWDRKLHHPGTNAVLIFVDHASMDAALKAVRRAAKQHAKTPIVWGEGLDLAASGIPPLGSARYAKHAELILPDPAMLLEHVDSYMSAFNAHTEAREKLLAEQRAVPDADGFVTVTRTGRKAGVKGVKQEAAREKLEAQKKKRGEGLSDFYRFQGRERAKERAGQLVKKFQEDVEKVREMRERKGRLGPA